MELRKEKYANATSLHNRLEQEISSYLERLVQDDGSVSFRKVENPYFMTENTWSVEVIGSIANFQDQLNKYNRSNRNIRFEFHNPFINLELKYVVFHKELFNDEWSFSSLFGTNFTNINRLTRFLNEKHPRLESLLDLNIDKADREWLFWLENQNILTQTIRKHDVYGEQIVKCSIAHFLRHMHFTISQLIDTREEWDKDRWDIRTLYATYGINYNMSQSQYFVDFSKIRNPSIRSNVKGYIKQRLLNKNNFSWSTAVVYMNVIPGFLNFICNLEPLWNDLKDLQRSHILKYIESLHQSAKKLTKRNSNPESYIKYNLSAVSKFLDDIQRYEYDLAPKTNTRQLGLINNQAISQGYTNSAGGPVVAFASATWLQNSGNSNYNSLQVSLERRARDLTFLASYTYAHSLDDVSAKFDPRDPHRAYGNSSFDLRHNLALSYNWDLPFAHYFGSRRITTGWHITGITRLYTGTPVSVKSGGDFALTNIGLDYPTQIGSIHKLNPRDSAKANYFNTSAFAFNFPDCDGNAPPPNVKIYEACGVTGSAKQFLFAGPGWVSTDLGVEKDTKITESMALNFRFEMFNVFNHTNFLTSGVVGNANSSQFGQATTAAAGRIGQISAKFVF